MKNFEHYNNQMNTSTINGYQIPVIIYFFKSARESVERARALDVFIGLNKYRQVAAIETAINELLKWPAIIYQRTSAKFERHNLPIKRLLGVLSIINDRTARIVVDAVMVFAKIYASPESLPFHINYYIYCRRWCWWWSVVAIVLCVMCGICAR